MGCVTLCYSAAEAVPCHSDMLFHNKNTNLIVIPS